MNFRRKVGCFTVGLIWAVLMLLTFLGGALGDCFEPGCKQIIYGQTWRVLGVELLALFASAWFFYIGETKD